MHFGQQPRGSSEATQLVERPQTKEPNKIVNLHPGYPVIINRGLWLRDEKGDSLYIFPGVFGDDWQPKEDHVNDVVKRDLKPGNVSLKYFWTYT